VITFITVDPASKSLGLCLVKDKKITKSWTVQVASPSMAMRCMNIQKAISKLSIPKLSKVYIEVLNRRCHRRTLWSIGAILAGLGKFCTDETKVVDNEAKVLGRSLLVPSRWKKRFKVEAYKSGDKDKDAKILRAFAKEFPKRKIKSADEAVATFLAQILIEEIL